VTPPSWVVRFARFQGDVADRAEEYRVYLRGNGERFRISHELPEARPGKSLTEARTKLGELGLVPVESFKDSDKPKDEILGQSPADGAGVEKGAEVKLEISKGPPLVVVPRVIDLPCQQAKQVLESQGYPVTVVLNPNATVRIQAPGENSQVPPGTPVTLTCF